MAWCIEPLSPAELVRSRSLGTNLFRDTQVFEGLFWGFALNERGSAEAIAPLSYIQRSYGCRMLLRSRLARGVAWQGVVC